QEPTSGQEAEGTGGGPSRPPTILSGGRSGRRRGSRGRLFFAEPCTLQYHDVPPKEMKRDGPRRHVRARGPSRAAGGPHDRRSGRRGTDHEAGARRGAAVPGARGAAERAV